MGSLTLSDEQRKRFSFIISALEEAHETLNKSEKLLKNRSISSNYTNTNEKRVLITSTSTTDINDLPKAESKACQTDNTEMMTNIMVPNTNNCQKHRAHRDDQNEKNPQELFENEHKKLHKMKMDLANCLDKRKKDDGDIVKFGEILKEEEIRRVREKSALQLGLRLQRLKTMDMKLQSSLKIIEACEDISSRRKQLYDVYKEILSKVHISNTITNQKRQGETKPLILREKVEIIMEWDKSQDFRNSNEQPTSTHTPDDLIVRDFKGEKDDKIKQPHANYTTYKYKSTSRSRVEQNINVNESSRNSEHVNQVQFYHNYHRFRTLLEGLKEDLNKF